MTSHDRTSEFVELLTKSSRPIYAFIMSLVRRSNDADDVYQEVTAKLWQKFDSFTPGTNFTAWGCEVAYLKILDYRKRNRRAAAAFSDAFIEAMKQEWSVDHDEVQAQHSILVACIQRLKDRDQELIAKRYNTNTPPATIALERSCSLSAIHKALARIHQTLHDCIARSWRREERS